VDRRSDIFAVGLVAYELFSYRQAFPGETVPQVMNAIMRSTPTPLEELCPDLDPAIVSMVNKAMEKDPINRYQTLAAMATDARRIGKRLARARAADPSDLTVTLTLPPPPEPEPRRTPRLGTDRELLAKRRAERIETHLRAARQKFDEADYASAIDECEQASL